MHVTSNYDFHPIGIVVSNLEDLMSPEIDSTLAHSMLWPVARVEKSLPVIPSKSEEKKEENPDE